MTQLVRYLKLTLGVILGVVTLFVGTVYAVTSLRLHRTVTVPTHDFRAPTDSASIARGEHLVRSIAKCVDCHGQDLGGATLNSDFMIGTLAGPNITSGVGGLHRDFPDILYERAIRHGVTLDGRRLVFMPSEEYQYFSDADVGAVIAYVRSVPPVDRESARIRLGPMARALHLAGQFPLFSYDVVIHGEEVVAAIPEDTSVAYGRYLGALGCAGCHGTGYGGGKIPGTPPDFPPASNLTPSGIGKYSYEQFVSILKTGERPDGTALKPLMPIASTRLMSDVEFTAIWHFLRSLPPKEFGTH